MVSLPQSGAPEVERVLSGRASAHTGQRAVLVLFAAVLPWLAVIVSVSGITAGVQFAAYAVLVLATGFVLLVLFGGRTRQMPSLLLAPSLGIVALSSLSALALRGRASITVIALLWFVLGLAGAVVMWCQRRLWTEERIPYGTSLIVFSLLICVIYFVPVARRDAVLQRDGSFNWIYVDTQHFYAIAAGIRGRERPPVGPGTATEPLRYHFGPYAPAAILSAVTSLPLGDALARVTRGASQWALVLSCFAVGILLARRATGETFGGIVSVAGLFFYGSLLALFSREGSAGAILHLLPGVEVWADGGPFSHIILGHSLLHGMGAITVVLALCLVELQPGKGPLAGWRLLLFALLPALLIPLNSVAALYCLWIVSVLLFWEHLHKLQTWAAILAMLLFFVLAWYAMGLFGAPDSGDTGFYRQFGADWWKDAIGIIVGLGLRLTALYWIRRPFRDPMSLLVLGTVAGLLYFGIFVRLPTGNQHYGWYYLYCMMSLLAFARIPSYPWKREVVIRLASEWLVVTRTVLLLLSAAGAILAITSGILHHHTGVKKFVLKLLLVFVMTAIFAMAGIWIRHRAMPSELAFVIIAGLLVGFLAWITPSINYSLGRRQLDVTLSPGEVRGLERLRTLSEPGEEFATNRHAIPTLASRKERSYAYTALSERPVLLEGYLDRGVKYLPWFPAMQRDNALLFTTTDPNQLHQIAERWHVRWLVARPGTDISLSRPLPSWLIPETGTGSLKIYEVR